MSEIQQQSIELLPCPFCGGKAERIDIDDGDYAGGSCICCVVCQSSSTVEFGYKENFVSNWNRRANAARAEAAEAHPDDLAVDRFAAAMKAKLAQKRDEGRGGWDNPDECTVEFLSELLRDHVGKGDPVDVGNFAMMIQQRGAAISAARAQGVEVAVKPLEWKKGYCDEIVEIKNASFGGSYQIRALQGEIWVDWPPRSANRFRTEEDAIAAVQADYEQRIRSALTTPPAPQPTEREDVAKTETKTRFHIKWIAGARPPVHPTAMIGHTTFTTFERALKHMKNQADDAQFVSLEEQRITVVSVDRSADLRAALATPPAPQPTDREKVLEEALRPFAECADLIETDVDDEEWAKFRLVVKDYRIARAALAGGEA